MDNIDDIDNMDNIELIRASEDDFPSVRNFYDTVIDYTKNMEKYAKWKKECHPYDEAIRGYIRDNNMYLSLCEGRIIAAMGVPFSQDEEYGNIPWSVEATVDEVATLHIFCVSPDWQGKGYGSKVLQLLIDMARENGIKVFRLDTFAINLPAQKLYEKMGFIRMGSQYLYTENAGVQEFYYYEKAL